MVWLSGPVQSAPGHRWLVHVHGVQPGRINGAEHRCKQRQGDEYGQHDDAKAHGAVAQHAFQRCVQAQSLFVGSGLGANIPSPARASRPGPPPNVDFSIIVGTECVDQGTGKKGPPAN